MQDLQLNFDIVKWGDSPHTQSAIKKGYVSPKNPCLYIVGSETGFIHYELEISYYYLSDIGKGETKEDVIRDLDLIGFWSNSKDPLKDLFTRLLQFYEDQSKVLDYRKTKNDYSCIRMLPTNTNDRFIEDHIISFISGIDKNQLVIPYDYKQAKEHIESLEYKYRKFVELFNKVVVDPNWELDIIQVMRDYIK